MTYWSASDPTLTVNPNGTGTLTATASGFGSDMDDASKWTTIRPRVITLANVSAVQLAATGFTSTPDYAGVEYRGEGRSPQAKDSAGWGSFPTDFVNFQVETGQSSYWYSSGGQRDKAKPALPITVCFDANNCTADAGAMPQSGDSATAGAAASAPPVKTPPKAPTVTSAAATAPVLAGASGAAMTRAADSVLVVDFGGLVTDSNARLAMILMSLIFSLGGLSFIAGMGGTAIKLGLITIF